MGLVLLPYIRIPHPRFLCAAALVVGAFVACDSPTEPPGPGDRVPTGEVISGSLSDSDSLHRYSFLALSGQEYAVFLEASEGGVISLLVRDSVTGQTQAALLDQVGGPGLDQNATDNIRPARNQVFSIELRGLGVEPIHRYEFLVYEAVPAPENRDARFTIGDTVSGEVLDPVADVDEFVAAGEAGQEIAGIVYGLNPTSAGLLGLSVTNPATGEQLGFTRGAPGGLDVSTASGRFTLPEARDYAFTVRGVSFGGRYTGPYRFWFHTINRAPETVGANIAVNTEVAGETIDKFGDVDEFTFTSAAGAEFNVFLQGSAPRQARLEVQPPAGPPLASTLTVPGDTGLFQHATGRFRVAQAGTVTVRVAGLSAFQVRDTGAYRFYVYAVNPLPEHVSEAITPGDTISGENIHLPGDVDEFSFTGTAGAEFNTFLQALNGSAETVLTAEVVRPGGAVLATTASKGSDTSLHHQATGRFSLPVTGSYRIRVTSASSTIDRDTGEYRFQLYAVNPQPELSPQALTLGDSVDGERIDLPGDYDRFTLSVPSGTLANVVLWRDDSTTIDGVTLLVTGAAGATECFVTVYSNNVGGSGSGCGTFAIGAGAHVITVQATSTSGAGYRGAYRLHTHVISDLAEIALDSLAVGDTVSGDAVDPLGDQDSFYFRGRRGDHVDVHFQAMGTPHSTFGLWLSVLDPVSTRSLGSVGSVMGEASLDARRTGRIDLTADGRYHVFVNGVNGGRLVVEQGPYRFAVNAVSTAIETASPNLVGGDSVGTERIDIPGDVDRFTLTGPAGQELLIRFQAFPETSPLVLAVLDTTTRDTLTTQLSAGFLQSSGRFVLPAAGVAWVRVLEPRFCDTFSGCGSSSYSKVGPYSLKVVTINRAPEVASATVTIGDTISGEAIDPVGDIDDFTFAGTGGRTVRVYFQTPQGVCCFDPLLLELMDPANNAVLGSVTSGNPTPNLEDQTTSAVVLPRTDQFRVRVRGSSDRYGAGAFRFRVVEMP